MFLETGSAYPPWMHSTETLPDFSVVPAMRTGLWNEGKGA